MTGTSGDAGEAWQPDDGLTADGGWHVSFWNDWTTLSYTEEDAATYGQDLADAWRWAAAHTFFGQVDPDVPHWDFHRRIQVADWYLESGRPVPPKYQHVEPSVIWRRRGCQHRLLRVFPTPHGLPVDTDKSERDLKLKVLGMAWFVVGDLYPTPPKVFARLVQDMKDNGETPPAKPAWVAENCLVRLDDHPVSLMDGIRVGCEHTASHHDLTEVFDDIRRAEWTLRPVNRQID